MSNKTAPAETASREERISVARNPKASHDYHLLDTMEAGLVLTGTEVKSLRRRGASIKEGFARISRGEVWVEKLNITPYEQGNRYNHDPVRSRKLLLNRREIEKLIGAVERDGLSLIPLELYFLRGRAKLLLALAKGKKSHDKREDLKKREATREVARAMSWRGRK
jgi:SsrA-binding protein